ncbi:MAG TPA: Crp/Fnr family transcriptional regulator [Burkholderiales bacterium]|nr:Crp/Fnr family transcriptional regulator [Burkholderiales bacterium]
MRREIRTEQFLARLPLFAGLGAAELERLAAATTRREPKRGEFLFRQGEPPTGFHAVVHGRIELRARTPHGRERVTDIVGAGRSFGEAIMFLDKPYIVSARALGDALVLHVAKDAVFDELERSPGFARRIIATLSAKLHAAARELDTYALGSAEKRFAAWLLRAAAPAERGAVSVTLPAAKRAIASRLNLSAEHLSRILRHLVSEGLIEVRGRTVEIPDLARLRAWSTT